MKAVSPALTHEVPARMSDALRQNVFIFSGMKTYAGMKEVGAMLSDEHGRVKPPEQFRREVEVLNKDYNDNYLRAEYNFAVGSAQNAAKWQQYDDEKDRYDLRYLTDNGPNVRASHRALEGTVLPVDDPFWNLYSPKNGWNCHCYVVQVRKGKYPTSDSEAAIASGEKATTQLGKDGKNKLEMFRFNAGKQQKVFPPNHPYTYAGNCGTKLSADSNDKCKALAIAAEDAAGKFGRVSGRAKEYEKLKKDSSYTDVQFNPDNGGLRATHIDHHFDPNKGIYERDATRVLYDAGNKIILDSEQAADGVKTPDGRLNDTVFDIKAVIGSGKNNIKNKLSGALSQGCEHIVLYYPDASKYDDRAVQLGYGKYLGVLRKEQIADRLKHIWIIAGEEIIVFK